MSEHTDELHNTRDRVYLPNHERTIEVQTLDALLRIEETLVSILAGLRHFAERLDPKKAEAPPAEKPVANRRRT